MRDREGLIARIRQIRRVAAAAEAEAEVPAGTIDSGAVSRLESLEARVAHLEHLLEGLQDSVYRESERQGKQIAELQAQTEPGAMGAALNKDARDRGLS